MRTVQEAAREHDAAIALARSEAVAAILGLVRTEADAAPALAALERLAEKHRAAHQWFLSELGHRLRRGA